MISTITGNLCCVKHKTRTAKVTICTITEDCPIASVRTPVDALPPSETQSIVVKHKHPRMNFKAVSVTQWCFFAQQSVETPKLSRDIEDGLREGRWVAAQKPHNSIWQGKPACWGRPGVQPRLPGPPRHQESWPQSAGNFGETSQAGPRSSFSQGHFMPG